MSISTPMMSDGGILRRAMPGDIIAGGEQILATQSATTLTITGAMLSSGHMLRNPAANATDTLDTAANIVNAIIGGIGNQGLTNGLTFRFRIIVTTAFTDTLTAPADGSITVNRGSIAASSAKEFLVTVVNGSLPQTLLCTTTNNSNVIGGVLNSQLATITPGMIITNAVAGCQGYTVNSVQQGAQASSGTITLSGNANATNATGVAFNFSPVLRIDGLQQGAI